ncbi:thioredoxin domain-containing protein [Sulfurovum sp.]|uniref:thioredoxin domain-containing protein n=1 Tax=Sulfurovum sp. TaxID=1969726 RepID=UPI003561478C
MRNIIFWLALLTFIHAEHNHTNALIHESSPYLQQHAYNPVNWYPWGAEAFAKAKKENKLIFLSIGYSTCHWCHVMEEESFTDDTVAKLLNDSYVSIKVDREEFPQLDKKYQKFYMSVHGERGGWPLSVFMSPEAEVFHLATYIPIEEGYGSIGMMNMLPSLSKLQAENTKQLQELVAKHTQAEIRGNRKENLKQKLSLNVMDKVVEEISAEFDQENGGFSSRPKFPEASKIALLIDIYKLNGNKKALDMSEKTLRKMAQGGIYDQIGGGFFRYTTDKEWQSPHFEKMLYTNAELIPLYVSMYALKADPLYKNVVDESIAQMETNFMKEGVYLSASDADSEGEEGGYFIYEYVEVKKDLLAQGLNLEEVEEVLAYLGIEEDGNIDGDLSHTHITSDTVPVSLEQVKTYLREVSSKRTFPFVDNKIITAWNAMMIKALFVASTLDSHYLTLAEQRLEALLKMMRTRDRLYHQTLSGTEPKQEGLLEDYAFLIDAMIEGYESTYNKKYLIELQDLANEAIVKFYREKRWYLSDDGIEAEADFDDRYYTSALSVMLENLVRVASLTEELSYIDVVKETIENAGGVLKRTPAKAPKLLHTFLRLKLGDVIIKSKTKKLQKSRKEIEVMQYPFVLSKSEESDKYLACRISSCFAYDTNITALIKQIENMVK